MALLDAYNESSNHAQGRRQLSKASGLTTRAVIAGLSIGILINLSNTYYGLQIGVYNVMSVASAFVGYAAFKFCSRWNIAPLTPAENVLLISTSSATGTMSATAGFIGMVPALQYLLRPEENGPLNLRYGDLFLWSLGLCFFGLFFAYICRKNLVERTQLPWPGASATAQVIGTLHQIPLDIEHATLTPEQAANDDTNSHDRGLSNQDQIFAAEWQVKIRLLARSSGISAVLSVLVYFVPILRALPVFGIEVSDTWLWNLDLTPGLIGSGLVVGPAVTMHMLLGSIFGWGFLSPYAKNRGWAPGPVDDWENGSRGWIIWVSLSSLFADATIKLGWSATQAVAEIDVVQEVFGYSARLYRQHVAGKRRGSTESDTSHLLNSGSIVSPGTGQDDGFENDSSDRDEIPNSTRPLKRSSISLGMSAGLLITILSCVIIVQLLFHQFIQWYYTLIAICLALPIAFVGIRSVAETDFNPASTLVSQLVFAALVPHSDPNAVIVNLIAAGIAYAGAVQSGDLAYDLKVGHLLGAQLKDQAIGQAIGSVFGAVISCSIYQLYASHYPLPGPLFQMPASYLQISTARLLLGSGLPEGVAPFVIGTFIITIIITMIKMRYATHWWHQCLPSGISFAVGIYLTPSFVLARALGGLIYAFCSMRYGYSKSKLVILGSGLMLGGSFASLINLALAGLRAP